jgi:hypothetical protein
VQRATKRWQKTPAGAVDKTAVESEKRKPAPIPGGAEGEALPKKQVLLGDGSTTVETVTLTKEEYYAAQKRPPAKPIPREPKLAYCVNPNCGRPFINEDRIVNNRHAACAEYLRRNERERPRWLVEQHPDALGPWFPEDDAEYWELHRRAEHQREDAERDLWLSHQCVGCRKDQECLQPGPYRVTWGDEYIRYSEKCASGTRCKALNTRRRCKDCARKRNKKGYDPIPETFTMGDDNDRGDEQECGDVLDFGEEDTFAEDDFVVDGDDVPVQWMMQWNGDTVLRVPPVPRHAFKNDGSGSTCVVCGLHRRWHPAYPT